MNVQITIDFRAVSHAKFFYRNQFGETSRTKPRKPSVHGVVIADKLAATHPDFPGETSVKRAIRLGILDRWTPVCDLQLRNNHKLRFIGDKAKEKWKAYNEHIYS